jgi:hypothetical protein
MNEEFYNAFKLNNEDIEIFKNPTKEEVGTHFGKRIEYDRGILTKTGLYVWSGEKYALHGDIKKKLNEKNPIFLYLYYIQD